MNETRQIGKIKSLHSRGFGFITSDDIDYFFHYTNFDGEWKTLIQKWLQNGKVLEVEFDIDLTSGEGPKAENVRLVQEMSDK